MNTAEAVRALGYVKLISNTSQSIYLEVTTWSGIGYHIDGATKITDLQAELHRRARNDARLRESLGDAYAQRKDYI